MYRCLLLQTVPQKPEEKICTIKSGCKLIIITASPCGNRHEGHGTCQGGFLQGLGILDSKNLKGEAYRQVINAVNGVPVGLYVTGREATKDKLFVYLRDPAGQYKNIANCSHQYADKALCQEGFDFFRTTILEKGAWGVAEQP